jgi:glyoxylase-like metal-dependent hydrolase (beta-lactamase superfamily II)
MEINSPETNEGSFCMDDTTSEEATMNYQTTELIPRIWAISEPGVQSFLIVGDEQALLFDCCMSGGEEFAEAVQSITDKPVMLVFSHTDGDHTAAQEYYPAPFLHPAEFDYYAAQGNDSSRARPLWEHDLINLGGVALEVILIPGHTPGSIALLDREHRNLFVGDTISDSLTYLFGSGRNLSAFIASLKKLEALKSEFDRVFCSHGTAALNPEWIERTRIVAERLGRGEIEGTDPPFAVPALLYSFNGVQFLYAEPEI